MEWDKLILPKQFGREKEYKDFTTNVMNFQYDYNRILYSSPFRRLENKRQVFPPNGNIVVHNRLTHSLEVSSVGRTLASQILPGLLKKYEGECWVKKLYSIVDIVSVSCLAHDIGNPPYGHPGEKAIASYFSEGKGQAYKEKLSIEEWNDLIKFDGNSNSFRLLTHSFNGKIPGGYTLTYSTLASLVKYPYSSNYKTKEKFGFTVSEKNNFVRIAEELGIIRTSENPLAYVRHPLVYLVEAADDISYLLSDIDDALRMKILSYEESNELLLNFFEPGRAEDIIFSIKNITDLNERNSILRSYANGIFIQETSKVFLENEERILKGELEGTLMDYYSPILKNALNKCKKIGVGKIYPYRHITGVDLSGYTIINTLTDILIHAILNPKELYSTYLLELIPHQFNINDISLYGRIQSVLDIISGMTDTYVFDFFNKITGKNVSMS